MEQKQTKETEGKNLRYLCWLLLKFDAGSAKTHCPKPPGDVISPRHETEVIGTPGTAPARSGFAKKNQNDQKII